MKGEPARLQTSPAANSTASPAGPPVSLDTLLASGIAISGDEAIAIGLALCKAFETAQLLRRIQAEEEGDEPVPTSISLESVLIDPASRLGIRVDSTPDATTAVQWVGHILDEIAPADTKRLLDSKESLDELARALSSHLKTDGRRLITALYARWTSRTLAPPLSPPELVRSAPVRVPVAVPPTPPTPPLHIRFGYKPNSVRAALGAAAVALGVVGWFLISAGSASRGGLLDSRVLLANTALVELRQPVGTARGELARSAPRRRAAPPVVARRSEPPTPAPAAARRNELPAAQIQDSRNRIEPAERPSPVPAARTTVAESSRPPADLPATTPPQTAAARPNASPAAAPAAAAVSPSQGPPSITYSAKDTDVTPPAPVTPRRATGLAASSPGVSLDSLAIAVVVNADGTPSSVSAVTRPQNMGEYVLLTSALSAVKGWQFTPATKDGAAVSYRLILPLRVIAQPVQ